MAKGFASGVASLLHLVTASVRPTRAAETVVPSDQTRGGEMNPSLTEVLPSTLVALKQRYEEKNVELFLADEPMLALQNIRIAKAVLAFFENTNAYRGVSFDHIAASIDEFRGVFLGSPIVNNKYGANFPSGVNLFLIARCLSPTMIVESGVYKGFSSYILSAACPMAKVHAFDVNLKEVAHRTPAVTYYEHDWMNADMRCDPVGTGLCFFDDHQNQALRLIQAHERGFRHVLFDDSWPIDAVTGCGWPPLPSIDMVLDDSLSLDQTVTWVESGKLWTYVHTAEKQELCARARRLIKAAYDVPSLYRESGIAPTSAYKFVELQ